MANPMESWPTPGQEKIMNTEVDQNPMYENKFEEFNTALIETLSQVTPQDMRQAREYIEKNPEVDNADLLDAINAINRLKDLQNKQDVLDKLAKTKLFELDRVRLSGMNGIPETLGNAIHQLSIACDALAHARFPEDLAKQEKWAKEARAEETEEIRRKIQGLKVS